MAFESLTDEKIQQLIECPKRVTNAQARTKLKEGHEQTNYKVTSIDGSNLEFELYKRRNLREGMSDDFSCGIAWIAPNGELVTLARYNGSSHTHCNQLERGKLGYNTHIHKATERYLRANKKAEGFAEITARYNTLNGALHCLVVDCNISGITTTSDVTNQINLFNNEP